VKEFQFGVVSEYF